MFWRKKKQKGAAYPEPLDDTTLEDLYKLDAKSTIMGITSRWDKEKEFAMSQASCSSYGQEIYDFVDPSGSIQYIDRYGNVTTLNFDGLVIICLYCGSKNNQKNFVCSQCGAPL